jgi:hypothetical protein
MHLDSARSSSASIVAISVNISKTPRLFDMSVPCPRFDVPNAGFPITFALRLVGDARFVGDAGIADEPDTRHVVRAGS